MGRKYIVSARLSGICAMDQETAVCKSFIGFIFTVIKFRLKYPIVDAQIRNGYESCEKCNMGENKPFCYHGK